MGNALAGYDMHYEDYIEQFVTSLRSEFGPTYFDWIDAPEGNAVDLDHVDPDAVNPALFEVEVGLHTGTMTPSAVDQAHTDIQSFAKDRGVSVDLTESNPDSCVYTFSLHSQLMGGHPEELGRNT